MKKDLCGGVKRSSVGSVWVDQIDISSVAARGRAASNEKPAFPFGNAGLEISNGFVQRTRRLSFSWAIDLAMTAWR